MRNEGPYRPAGRPAHRRTLQPELKLDPAEQTLAVYPANLAPHPYPFPFRMDREAGIRAHEALVTPDEYRRRLANGDADAVAHRYRLPEGPVPVLALRVTNVERMTDDIAKYELASTDGAPLPPFGAGAHIDVVVAPEYLRQYSLSGDPADRSTYQIAILREPVGRGGSALAHRVFAKGRRVFVSRPIQHFPLVGDARRTCSSAAASASPHCLPWRIGCTRSIACSNCTTPCGIGARRRSSGISTRSRGENRCTCTSRRRARGWIRMPS